ncbi:MAG: ROK family transcriptional regulator [Chloroflexota bacterium]
MRTGRRELIRDLNRALVLNLVRERDAISRADIARVTGLSPSTVTAITASLLADGLLVEDAGTAPSATGTAAAAGTATLGRPATLLRVDPAAGYVVGIKLAVETLTATVTDLDATPLAMVSLPHGPAADREAVADLFARAVEEALAAAGVEDGLVFGVGIGVPGMVDPATGQVHGSPLPDWAEADLADLLEERLGLPVLVDNDVNTLTVAEQLFGQGRGLSHLLVITIGRGIGMGSVVNGTVHRGARGGAGEIGHIEVIPDGPLCWCGLRGCLEAVAAEPAIAREVLAATGRLAAPAEIAGLAAADPRVAAILSGAGRMVGRAMATVARVTDPQRVIVSGEGVRLGPSYLAALRAAFEERQPAEGALELVVEPWGDEAWARGAATLVLRELFHPAHLRDEGSPPASPIVAVGAVHPKVARSGRGGGR